MESKILTILWAAMAFCCSLYLRKKEAEYNSENALIFVWIKTVKRTEIQKIRYQKKKKAPQVPLIEMIQQNKQKIQKLSFSLKLFHVPFSFCILCKTIPAMEVKKKSSVHTTKS